LVTRGPLRRRTEHRLVAGVAGGIADRLNASVGFVRAFLLIASLWAFPWILAVYAACALVIPPRGSTRPGWDNLIAVARLGVLVGVPLLLIPSGLVLSEAFHGPAGWWIAYYGLLVAGAVAFMGVDYRREHPRSRAEVRTAALAAVPVAGCFLCLAAGMLLAPDVRWERFVPVVALVGAAALLAGDRRRSPDAFIAPALLAMAVAGVAVAADARLQGGLGDTDVTPEPTTGEPILARRAMGDLSVDLRRVGQAGRDATLEATVGVGSLQIMLPRRARVVLDARVGQGRIEAYSIRDFDPRQGFDQRMRRSARPARSGSALPTIRVKARVGLGAIEFDTPGASLVEERS
jgi:phage shock protein PspC (stress-responsive transcriptional regulator)